MRTLAITQNITVDGSIEMLGDWFDIQGQGDQAELLQVMAEQQAASDALLVGRQTFTDLRGYWRDLAEDRTGISRYLNQVQKYLVSRTLTDPQWDRTTVLDGELVEQVSELKRRAGGDIVVTGSITLSHALIGAGLVDEFRLFAYPVVQGRGRPLFPDGFAGRLRLSSVQSFESGIVLLIYAT